MQHGHSSTIAEKRFRNVEWKKRQLIVQITKLAPSACRSVPVRRPTAVAHPSRQRKQTPRQGGLDRLTALSGNQRRPRKLARIARLYTPACCAETILAIPCTTYLLLTKMTVSHDKCEISTRSQNSDSFTCWVRWIADPVCLHGIEALAYWWRWA